MGRHACSIRCPERAAGRDDRAARQLGLRQDDFAAIDRRLCDSGLGSDRVDGRDITRLPPEARNGDDVSVLRLVAAHERRGQHRLRIAHAQLEKGCDCRARRRDAKLLQLEGFGPRSGLSFGWPAAASPSAALAVDPHLLLLDEPMSNLDYKVRLELRQCARAAAADRHHRGVCNA